MVGRSRDGKMEAFPVVETVHRDSILHVVEAPAQVPEAGQRAAQAVAQRAVACLEGGRRAPALASSRVSQLQAHSEFSSRQLE